MVHHQRKGNVFIIKIMRSGCTIKKMIEQFALASEAAVLKSVESIDVLQPSMVFLHISSVRYLIPLSYQCSNKTHFFTWHSLNEHLNTMHNLKVYDLVLSLNIFSSQSQLLTSDFSAPNLSLSLLPESSLWSTVQVIKDRSPNVSRRRRYH